MLIFIWLLPLLVKIIVATLEVSITKLFQDTHMVEKHNTYMVEKHFKFFHENHVIHKCFANNL